MILIARLLLDNTEGTLSNEMIQSLKTASFIHTNKKDNFLKIYYVPTKKENETEKNETDKHIEWGVWFLKELLKSGCVKLSSCRNNEKIELLKNAKENKKFIESCMEFAIW